MGTDFVLAAQDAKRRYVALDPSASVLAYLPGCQLVVDLNADNILGNDGDAITVWPDASGFGNHFIAGTTAPTLKKNIINGHAVMRTGAAGWMVSPPGIGIYPGITQPSFYVAVIRCDSGSGFRTILGGQSTTVNNLLLDTTQQTLSLNGGGTLPKGGKRLDDGLPHIVVGRFDTFSQGYADGVTVCFTSAGGSGAQALIGVGDKYTGGQNLVGDIGRVLMYNGRPSRAGLALLQQGLAR